MNSSERARLCLEGLSVGEQAFVGHWRAPVWGHTDDTAMAISIVHVLEEHGQVDQDHLAALFLARYRAEPMRGYGRGMHHLFETLKGGVPWRRAAAALFGGNGSLGNGGEVTCADTVPFVLWCAQARLDDYEMAVRTAVSVGGDTDTTAAMVGGIVVMRTGLAAVPAKWVQAREPLH